MYANNIVYLSGGLYLSSRQIPYSCFAFYSSGINVALEASKKVDDLIFHISSLRYNDMALIVQKFGGTSLADISMIRKIAHRIIGAYVRGDDLVVTLSAMAGVTDRLVRLAYEISSCPDKRELDVLLATGEQTTVSILAIILKQMGYRAQSALANQIGIITDSSHGNARIIDVNICSIKKIIRNRGIAIIAGFQGCDISGNITTLGRGGSDTSAVAIAAALRADLCEIYTDVGGIYTADPNICPEAKKLDKISYDEMFHMANLGTKVLHQDSINFAKKYNMTVHVRSSFSCEKGTMVACENFQVGRSGIIGITYDLGYARIMLRGIHCDCDVGKKILSSIIKVGIYVDMLVYNESTNDRMDFMFTVLKEEFDRALNIVRLIAKVTDTLNITSSEDTAKVSVVGFSINDHARIVSLAFGALGRENIEIIMVSVLEKEISCIIQEKHIGSAVRILHSELGLG